MNEPPLQGSNSSQANPFPQLLNTLLANPELMGRIKDMMASAPLTTEAKNTDAPPQTSTSATEEQKSVPTGSALGTDGLANILGDPAMMAKLPQIIAAVKPLLTDMPTAPSPAQPVSLRENPKNIPVCRDNLLLALKPFLSPKRCEAIDSMIRIAKLGELLGQLK